MQILPPELKITVRRRPAATSEGGLARADAAAFILADRDAAGTLAALPHGALWTRLYRSARRRARSPLLVSRLPNPRHTLVAVGFLPQGASAYARLELAGRLMQALNQPGVTAMQCHAAGFEDADVPAVVEALASAALAASAPLPQRKSKPVPPPDLATLEVHGARSADLESAVTTAAGNHLARWLTTLPPNELDCVAYRRALAMLARREGWSFRFYDERALGRLGAGAFLAVSRANAHRGAGIVRLGYRPRGARSRGRIGLVGKGICFDTGGINLKAHKGMYLMHGDMQGSAVAVGALLALSRRRAPLEIDCWLALTENEIGARAFRPQEVVRAMNGVTIQVVHSDAEGRMVLADALALAARAKPGLLLDFATLTGACVNALTERYSGAFTSHAVLASALLEAGRASGERVWCFPMDEDYDSDLDSSIADVLQCTPDSKGDHILAARFLSRFVPATIPWAHIDLSSSERKGGLAHVPGEFTGFGVRLAAQLLGNEGLLERLGSPS